MHTPRPLTLPPLLATPRGTRLSLGLAWLPCFVWNPGFQNIAQGRLHSDGLA